MRKRYIKPTIIFVPVTVENMLAGESGVEQMSRKHRFSFDDWNDYDEEEPSSFPRSKSVWDD